MIFQVSPSEVTGLATFPSVIKKFLFFLSLQKGIDLNHLVKNQTVSHQKCGFHTSYHSI